MHPLASHYHWMGLRPKPFSAAPLPATGHPEVRGIFPKCKPHYMTCLGGMPATWGWSPALTLGAFWTLWAAFPALAPTMSPLVLDGGPQV